MAPVALPLALTLFAATAWVLPLSVSAEEPASPVHVSVRIRVVEAGEEQGQIDQGCEELQRVIAPMRFGSMRMVEDRLLDLTMGQPGQVMLPTGDFLQLLPISIVKQRLHMHVLAPKINGRLQMRRGQPVVVGGQRMGSGHMIVYIVPQF